MRQLVAGRLCFTGVLLSSVALVGAQVSRVEAARRPAKPAGVRAGGGGVGAQTNIRYTVEDLGRNTERVWRRLSNDGTVIGEYYTGEFWHAAIWRNSQLMDIHGDFSIGIRPTTSGNQEMPLESTYGKAISPGGLAVIDAWFGHGNWDNVRLWQDGELISMTDDLAANTNDVNDNGWFVGTGGTGSVPWQYHAGYSVLPVPRVGGNDANGYSTPLRVNAFGMIMGAYSTTGGFPGGWVLDPQGNYSELGNLTGPGENTYVKDLNDLGQVVGESRNAEGYRPFLWQNGVMQDISGASAVSRDFRPTAINNGGLVGGAVAISGVNHAGLLINGEFEDLTSEIEDIGAYLDILLDINDNGQILVSGYHTQQGARHFYLLTRIPEDTTAPVVTVIAPAADASVASPVTIRADITEANDVTWTLTIDSQASGSGNTKGTNAVDVSRELAPGSHTLTVTAEDGAGNIGSASRSFTVPAPFPAPTISSVSPTSGRLGQTLNVTLNGSGFRSPATVSFGDGITVNSAVVSKGPGAQADHILTCGITIAANAALGARNVTVTNPDGQSVTRTGGFTVTAVPVKPGILNVAPAKLKFKKNQDGTFDPAITKVTNVGKKGSTLTGMVTLTGSEAYALLAGSGPYSLAAKASQIIHVRFAPSGPGTYRGTLTITSNDPKAPQTTIALKTVVK